MKKILFILIIIPTYYDSFLWANKSDFFINKIEQALDSIENKDSLNNTDTTFLNRYYLQISDTLDPKNLFIINKSEKFFYSLKGQNYRRFGRLDGVKNDRILINRSYYSLSEFNYIKPKIPSAKFTKIAGISSCLIGVGLISLAYQRNLTDKPFFFISTGLIFNAGGLLIWKRGKQNVALDRINFNKSWRAEVVYY